MRNIGKKATKQEFDSPKCYDLCHFRVFWLLVMLTFLPTKPYQCGRALGAGVHGKPW